MGSKSDKGNQQQGAEVKQAVLSAEILNGPRRIRVAGFPPGDFMKSKFDGEGVSVAPVPAETVEALRRDFPGAEIEFVEDGPEVGEPSDSGEAK